MPFDQVPHKFKHGQLHSGSKNGPLVKKRNQMLAIMMSEKREAGKGKEEYSAGPSEETKKKMFGKKGKK